MTAGPGDDVALMSAAHSPDGVLVGTELLLLGVCGRVKDVQLAILGADPDLKQSTTFSQLDDALTC